MNSRIDHFMYAVPSLDEGMQWAADTFGVQAAYGGEHVGLGTRNALMSLGSTYLEIIAPDPAQSYEGTSGEKFANLSAGGLVTWAAEGDLKSIAVGVNETGLETHGPSVTQRKTQTGEVLVWELLFPLGSAHGTRMPFFIDWLDCANPKDTNPVAGEFQSLSITTSNAPDLSGVLTAIGLDLVVEDGAPALAVVIESTRGTVTLASTEETANIKMR
ncbi:MAG: hypothetical protein GKR90_10370 [Pseudomonadales bacterium]|nr:hypothetical protein [Pseudomonadales bacterium]